MSELQNVMFQAGPLIREQDLTGPHHVGAEVDLEMQAMHVASWRFMTKLLFGGAALSFLVSMYSKGPAFRGYWGGFAVGLGVAGGVASGMSRQVCSRAVTSAPPALEAMVGETGSWQPIGWEKSETISFRRS
jgi:hypothetical protein